MTHTRILSLAAVLVGLLAGPLAAQTVEADRFRLVTGPCVVRSGSGTPEAVVTGNVCDRFVRTDTGQEYFKLSGSGNTGWITWGSANVASTLVSRDASGNFAANNVTVVNLTATNAISTNVLGATGNLTVNPSGDIILDPGGNDILPLTNYDLNLGALNLKYLTLHAAELWVETLVAQNTIATIGGRILVAPTTTFVLDVATGDTAIIVKHNQMAAGARVYAESNGKVEFMAIVNGPFAGNTCTVAAGTGPVGSYCYGVTRDLDGSGANVWYAGDALLNTGTTGDGFIDLYSVAGVLSGSGPTIVGNVRTGTTYSNIAARWAIGNLNGLYGYGATTYGAAFGDASATNVTVDATNGFRIRSGTTDKFKADTSGNLSLVGNLSIGTSGTLSSGATAFGTGTGYWLAYNGGTPQFRIGTTAGNRFSWDGSDVTLVANTVSIGSTGVTVAGAATSADNNSYKFSPYSIAGTDYGLYVGEDANYRYMYLTNVVNSGAYGASLFLSARNAAAGGSTQASIQLAATATSGTNIGSVDIYAYNGGTTTVNSKLNQRADISGSSLAGTFGALQASNTLGHYWAFAGGVGGATDRGYIGYAHTGGGTATMWSGEVADAFGVMGVGILHLGITANATPAMTIQAGVSIGTTTDPGSNNLSVAGTTTLTGTTTLGAISIPGAAGGGNRALCVNNSGTVTLGSPGC